MFKFQEHKGKKVLGIDCILWADVQSENTSKYHYSKDFEAFYEQFELLAIGALASKNDFYYGQAEFIILKEKATGDLYGYPYFQGGGKHGEAFYDSNGDQFGFEDHENPDYDEDFDYEEGYEEQNPDWIDYYAFLPVKDATIPAYELA